MKYVTSHVNIQHRNKMDKLGHGKDSGKKKSIPQKTQQEYFSTSNQPACSSHTILRFNNDLSLPLVFTIKFGFLQEVQASCFGKMCFCQPVHSKHKAS